MSLTAAPAPVTVRARPPAVAPRRLLGRWRLGDVVVPVFAAIAFAYLLVPVAYTVAQAYSQSGTLDVSVFAYQWSPGTVYHFVMITRGGTGVGPFVPMVQSIRRISPAEAAAIRPRIIHVETVKPGDTVQSLAGRMAYRTFQLDRFLSLNNLAPNARLVPGQRVKLVVYGARRA